MNKISTILLICLLSIATCENVRRNLQVVQPLPVNLLTAAGFAILTETGITNVPTSAITGNVGASPITGSAIGVTCVQVTGTIYQVDAGGAACMLTNATKLTQAISDMGTAYTNTYNLVNPTYTQLYAGSIGGQVLTAGLYFWSSNVIISTNVNVSGAAGDIFIFQIAGNLTVASTVNVTLIGAAQAANIFWVVAGAQVSIGTGAIFQGTILAKNLIAVATGAAVYGRLLSQTQVTLQSNVISLPVLLPAGNCTSPCSLCVGVATNCTACISATNFILTAGQCLPCNASCNGCSINATNCMACASGNVWQPLNSSACSTTCPLGTVLNQTLGNCTGTPTIAGANTTNSTNSTKDSITQVVQRIFLFCLISFTLLLQI